MYVIQVTALLLLGQTPAAAQEWWDEAWACRQRIYINASEINADLDGFPLTLRLDDAQFARTRAREQGEDVRFVDANRQVLDHAILRWQPNALEFVVKVPKIRAGAPGQYVDLYYGNPQAPKPPASASLWDDHCRLVLPLAGTLEDARGKQNVVTVVGQVDISDGATFNGQQPGYLAVAPELLQGIGEQITVLVRFRTELNPGAQTLVSGMRKEANDTWFNFGLHLPHVVHTNAASHGKLAGELNPQGVAPGEWHSAVVRYDARDHSRTICIDGLTMERDQGLPGPLDVDEIRIGRGLLHFDSWQFHGAIAELRLSDVARSDAWMKAEAACLSDRNTFVAIGLPQGVAGAFPPPAPFDLVAPPDGAQSRKRAGATASWRPSAGAETYSLLIYTDAAATQLLETIQAGPASHAAIPANLGAGRKLFWTVSAKSSRGETRANDVRSLSFYDWSQAPSPLPEERVHPALNPAGKAEFALTGYLRERIEKVIRRYFDETPESSPAILQVLRDRDKTPVRDPLVPWAGEFAGKYLTAAELTWRLTRDANLKGTIDAFVRDLIASQAENGYLGPFPESARLTGPNWDIWGHYHCMLGLLLYYDDTGDAAALEACKKAADLLFETFGPGGPTLTNDGSGGQMNMAVCHGLVLLYKRTGVQRYLDLAKYIVHDAWNDNNAGRYLESALAGKRLVEFPQHRWEAIHDWQALPELYWLTGDEQYRRAFEHIWWDGVNGDRHNTGGVTSGEGFQGSPYNLGAIETCCTVAWIAAGIDMLRLTGDSRVADEIEWSTLNSALGAIPYSGRACAYNVPMDGTRTFGVELPWQSPKAGPDLNCCAVNANRPLGMIAQWAIMQSSDGIMLNYYGPGTLSAVLPSGNRIVFKQQTDYPADGAVRIELALDRNETFALGLRIPGWSAKSSVSLNGKAAPDVVPGRYLTMNREWRTGDTIELAFDFGLRVWAGEAECAGKLSIYRGPILYAFDGRYNDLNPDQLPVLDRKTAKLEPLPWQGAIPPWILATLSDGSGTKYTVCDLSSAGQTGNHYRSWLPAKDLPPSPFHLLSASTAEGRTTFTWESHAGAESWTLLISTTPRFDDAKRIKTTEPKAEAKLEPGEYLWTVVASNAHRDTYAANGPLKLTAR